MIAREDVLDALRGVIDPEIGLDIVDLGLIETLEVSGDGIRIGLIMTTPSCPQGDLMSRQAEDAVADAAGGGVPVTVDVLAEPLWTPERMSESARRRMGWR